MRSSKADDEEADDEAGVGGGGGGGGERGSDEDSYEIKSVVEVEDTSSAEGGGEEEDGVRAASSEDALVVSLPPKKKRKYKRDKPPRSKDWDDNSIRLLISEYGARFAKTTEETSERATEGNRRTWKEITRKLRKTGYSFSVKNARKKWDSLESVYVDMASHNIHPGLKRITCPYGRELTAILNPGGMKNYLQIEEEEQKDMEKAEKEKDSVEEITIDEMDNIPKVVVSGIKEGNTTVGRPKGTTEEEEEIGGGGGTSEERSNFRKRDSNAQSFDSDSDVITLTDQSDDEPKILSHTHDVLPAGMKPNVVLQKSDNYVEFAQSEPASRPESSAGSSQSTSPEDVVLGIAFQMYRHFSHHQHITRPETSRKAAKQASKEGQSSSSEAVSSPGHQTNQSPQCSRGSSVMPVPPDHDNEGLLAPLHKVIERLMAEKERKMALLEERNEIDKQRIAIDQTRVRLMDQLITIVSSRRNT